MAFVLKADEKETVCVTNKTWVTEENGRKWFTKEPAICYFYPDKWFNIICMLRPQGIYYYCNLASPALWDGEALKYIDYDLDVKVFPDGSQMILDANEYEAHCKSMNYPGSVMRIISKETQELLRWIKEGKEPFNKEFIEKVFDEYLVKLYENDKLEYQRVTKG